MNSVRVCLTEREKNASRIDTAWLGYFKNPACCWSHPSHFGNSAINTQPIRPNSPGNISDPLSVSTLYVFQVRSTAQNA